MMMAYLILAIAGCGLPSGGSADSPADAVARLKAEGKLRTDRAPSDAPFSNDDLVRNFINIALQYAPDDLERLPTPLSKWAGPIRYGIEGASVTEPDRRALHHLMTRFSRLIGLTVVESSQDRNFEILIFDDSEAAAYVENVREEWGRYPARLMAEVFQAPDCSFIIFGTAEDENVIGEAVTFHRAGLPEDYRQQCFHEEIAQSLGLFNDDPEARPSIFNDDEEFAFLTLHDEYLLRILYDARLRPGMTPEVVRPIIAEIVEEMRPREMPP